MNLKKEHSTFYSITLTLIHTSHIIISYSHINERWHISKTPGTECSLAHFSTKRISETNPSALSAKRYGNNRASPASPYSIHYL